jgi:phosphopantetheine--protein transferase-like protein
MNKAKKIVATFLKEKEENINESTIIDKTAIQGSVLIHRMYSELRSNGLEINNINDIVTFGDLKQRLIGEEDTSKTEFNTRTSNIDSFDVNVKGVSIGIDLESPENIPDTSDYFSEQFYKDNFSEREIGYCSSQNNPKICFSGRFATKEAIVKADNSFINTPFNEIEILISECGRPLFQDFNLSISHVNLGLNQLSIAIAQKINTVSSENTIPTSTTVSENAVIKLESQKPEPLAKNKSNFHRGLLFSSIIVIGLIIISFCLQAL